jgi:hypothetical protein
MGRCHAAEAASAALLTHAAASGATQVGSNRLPQVQGHSEMHAPGNDLCRPAAGRRAEPVSVYHTPVPQPPPPTRGACLAPLLYLANPIQLSAHGVSMLAPCTHSPDLSLRHTGVAVAHVLDAHDAVGTDGQLAAGHDEL